MMSESQFWTNGQNSEDTAKYGPCEIMLFGVRVKVDPLKKSVSMNDLSQYVHVHPATHDSSNNSNNLDSSVTGAADSGYASANDAIRNQSNGGRERKRGIPWTEDEHKLFLLGLQKVGKGDWRGISRKFVKTRTPTQVASHAQKHFLRRSNLNRRRRRSSLFDITTDSVEHQVHEDNNIQPMQFSPQISPLSGFPMAAVPATVGKVPSPPSIMNQMETVTVNNCHRFNGGPPVPTLDLSTRGDNYMHQEHENDSLSLSLSLSISCVPNNEMDSSVIQSISGFNNGELVMV